MRSIVIKPTWNDPNVVDGCVDVNVFLRFREGGESYIDTPTISILRSLPARYTRRGDGQVVEMELVFYRIAKVNRKHPLTPYVRTDSKTKLIKLEEDVDGNDNDNASATIKAWNADDEDCALPSVWICEFEMNDEEKATRRRYVEERYETGLYDEDGGVSENNAMNRIKKSKVTTRRENPLKRQRNQMIPKRHPLQKKQESLLKEKLHHLQGWRPRRNVHMKMRSNYSQQKISERVGYPRRSHVQMEKVPIHTFTLQMTASKFVQGLKRGS